MRKRQSEANEMCCIPRIKSLAPYLVLVVALSVVALIRRNAWKEEEARAPMQALHSLLSLGAIAKPSLTTPRAQIRVRSLYSPATTFNDPIDSTSMAAPKWAQKTITIPPHRRGCHLITPEVSSSLVLPPPFLD